MIALLALALGGCAISAPTRAPGADPRAPVGRLAGPPPALRAGVVEYADVPPLRAPTAAPAGHHHHGSGE